MNTVRNMEQLMSILELELELVSVRKQNTVSYHCLLRISFYAQCNKDIINKSSPILSEIAFLEKK